MHDVLNENSLDEHDTRRCSTPARTTANQWPTELINICTDCFFLLQQIRKKSRQRHITSAMASSTSSSSLFNRLRQSNSNQNISSSSSAQSIAALLAQQRTLIIRSKSLHSNLKQTRSVQDLSAIADALASNHISTPTERVRPSRNHLFLQLQPNYDPKINHVKTG